MHIAALTICALLPIAGYFILSGSAWSSWDYKVLDSFFSLAVKRGNGPGISPLIVYLPITDSTYSRFGKNILDRADLAEVNDALSELDVEALAYDMIFARQSNPVSDLMFEESVSLLASVYLPIGFSLKDKQHPFKWEEGAAFQRLGKDILRRPVEQGSGRPFYGVTALTQHDGFAEASFGSGHINAISDPDGVYRHMIMLIKVDDTYCPSLSLKMFLDYARVPFEKIIVRWGRDITIPAIDNSYLENDVIIPIDDRGRSFIPFVQTWEKDFDKMDAYSLLEYMGDEDLRGNLRDFFEGKFVFMCDVSVGTSDLGQTPLEKEAPLVVTHTNMLNGMLTNTFYRELSLDTAMISIFIIIVFLFLAAIPKNPWFLYSAGAICIFGLLGVTWQQFAGFQIIPIVTIGACIIFILAFLSTGIEIILARERAFIKNAFSRYVPEKVVNQLLSNPDMLKLGGEERVMTALFSDIEGFTTISEKMKPDELVSLLNEYLTEMTDVIIAEGGIIDKYQGDAIMAEFGAPIESPDHADMAVRAALNMQRRLKGLRDLWEKRRLPGIQCRIGINSGPMIIGNMGSARVFDYTVIGDAVNLASRLEGANKLYNTFLMISEATHDLLTPGLFKMRVLDVIKVKGKTEAVKVFEVYGNKDDYIDSRLESYYMLYNQGFEAYLSRDISTSLDKFISALSIRPGDPASVGMIDRINSLSPENLPDDWDGSVSLKTK